MRYGQDARPFPRPPPRGPGRLRRYHMMMFKSPAAGVMPDHGWPALRAWVAGPGQLRLLSDGSSQASGEALGACEGLPCLSRAHGSCCGCILGGGRRGGQGGAGGCIWRRMKRGGAFCDDRLQFIACEFRR